MDRLKKKFTLRICVTFSWDYKFGNTLKQSRDLQLHISDISFSFHWFISVISVVCSRWFSFFISFISI